MFTSTPMARPILRSSAGMWFRGTWLGGKPALLDAASVPRLAAACREMSTREWSMFNEDVAAQMTTARHEADTPPRDSAASLVAEIAARVPAELVPLWKRHGQDVMMTTTLPALTELVAASLGLCELSLGSR